MRIGEHLDVGGCSHPSPGLAVVQRWRTACQLHCPRDHIGSHCRCRHRFTSPFLSQALRGGALEARVIGPLRTRRITRLWRSSDRFAKNAPANRMCSWGTPWPPTNRQSSHTAWYTRLTPGSSCSSEIWHTRSKKPIRTDFLDFSTQQRRERALQRELELNRRLASASYSGVAHLSAEWAGTSEPVLVMKRHPDSSRLATMCAAANQSPTH